MKGAYRRVGRGWQVIVAHSGKASQIVRQLGLAQSVRKPCPEVGETDFGPGNRNDKIVYRFVFVDQKYVAAAVNQDFHQDPCGSLVPVDESVIADHAVKQGGAFFRYRTMIARVGPSYRRFHEVEAGNAASTSERQRLVMSQHGVRESDAVVPPSDQPNASKRHGADLKPP